MKNNKYIVPSICLIDLYEDFCAKVGDLPVVPLSVCPQLSKKNDVDFTGYEDEEDEDTWLKEQ